MITLLNLIYGCCLGGLVICLSKILIMSMPQFYILPPTPNAYTSLPLQSYVYILKTRSISAALLFLVLFGIFMTLSHRIPVRILFTELDILPYYPLYNAALACLVTMVLFGLKDRSYTSVNIAFAFILSLSGSLLLAYINLHCCDLIALLTILGIDISLLAYSGSGSYYKISPDTTIGGGGGGSSSGSGRGGGSGGVGSSGSGSSRPQPTSSGDNTTMAPATLQYYLSTITEEATAIANDPVKLLDGLDNFHSAFRFFDNLPNETKAEIIREAESSSPIVEPVHHQLPQKQTLLDY